MELHHRSCVLLPPDSDTKISRQVSALVTSVLEVNAVVPSSVRLSKATKKELVWSGEKTGLEELKDEGRHRLGRFCAFLSIVL